METRGDVRIRGLWDRQTNSIMDVKLGDTDVYTYRFEPMLTLLAWWEKIKKNKHGKE